jgi:molybdate transport system ATP-binding protein
MSCLSFQCLHRYPSDFELDARFEIGQGVTALFGPSGSGKSTILSILAGILRADAGVIRLGDRLLFDRDKQIDLAPEQRSIGVVFQEHLLFPHKTIRGNLEFGMRRRPARIIDFQRVVEILDLHGLLDRYPASLSGGQRQRVALGRAILRGPELLLMDEPLNAVDERLKDRILTYLARAISEWHIPTLFVSHDQSDVRRLADHVIVMDAGRVVSSGPTKDTLDRALIHRLDSESGPVNLLRVENVVKIGEHFEGNVGWQRLRLPGNEAPDGPALVQFLPRDVMLGRDDVTGVSARNHLVGVVREIITAKGRTFVAIDAGQFLWAEVTPEAIAELGLQSGERVVCLLKTSAIRLLR